MVYAIVGSNCITYVDRIIKLMENVPELLMTIGFLKSSLMSFGYKMIFKIIKIKNIVPMPPKRYLKKG